MILVLAILTTIGFVFTVVLNLVAVVGHVDPLASMPAALLLFWVGVGLLSCVVVLWLTRMGSPDFWANLTNNMPSVGCVLPVLLLSYAMITLTAGGRAQGGVLGLLLITVPVPDWVSAWQLSSFILFLYALPMAYAWSEWWANRK